MIRKFLNSILVSKTVLVNTLFALLTATYTILKALGYDVQPDDVQNIWNGLISLVDHYGQMLVIVMAIVNVFLRWMTKKPVEEKRSYFD